MKERAAMLQACDALEIRKHAGVGVFPESSFSSLLVFCMTSNGQETARYSNGDSLRE